MLMTKDENRIQVFSNGGGVQSTAIIVLIAQNRIPKPDLVVMVDTEREKTDVLKYQDENIIPLCREIGVEYVRVKKSQYTKHDILLVSCETVLPGFFTVLNDRNGKSPSFCSAKWKQEVFQRYLTERYGQESKRGFDVSMGISLDEYRRVKVTEGKWQRKYPLIDLRLTREHCVQIVEKFGLPTPIRSACWMCPNKSDYEWRTLFVRDLEQAIIFEKELHRDYPYLYLHHSCRNLESIDFSKNQSQFNFSFCDSGMCFV
jgi:hypothetical protein